MRWSLFLLFSFLILYPVHARQTPTTSPVSYTQVATIGRGNIQSAIWRHDGQAFLVNSSRGAWVYSRDFEDLAHFEGSYLAVFSASGKIIASAKKSPNEVDVWDAQNYKLLTTITAEDDVSLVTAVAISPDDRQIAISSYQKVQVFNIASRRRVFSWSTTTSIYSLTWKADGQQLAIGNYTKVILLDTSNWQIQTQLEDLGTQPLALWSPDGQYVATLADYSEATGQIMNPLKVWDAKTFQLRVVIQASNARTFAWTPDGKSLVAGVDEYVGYPTSTLYRWNAQTGEILASGLFHPIFRKPILAVEWNAAGSEMLIAGADNMVRFNSWPDRSDQSRTLSGFSGEVTALDWSPDSTKIVNLSTDGGIHVWDAASGKAIATFEQMYEDPSAVAWSPDGGQIAIGGSGNQVHIWDVTYQEELGSWSAHGDSVNPSDGRGIISVAWKPDSHILASGGWDMKVRTWNTTRYENNLIQEFNGQDLGAVKVAWSPGGDLLAGLSHPHFTRQVQIWDPATGKIEETLECDACAGLSSLAWSADGSMMAVSGRYEEGGDAIFFWDMRSAAFIGPLNAYGGVISMDWSQTGQLAVVGYDQVYVSEKINADAPTVLELANRTTVKWSADGKRLAVGGRDGSITIWENHRNLGRNEDRHGS